MPRSARHDKSLHFRFLTPLVMSATVIRSESQCRPKRRKASRRHGSVIRFFFQAEKEISDNVDGAAGRPEQHDKSRAGPRYQYQYSAHQFLHDSPVTLTSTALAGASNTEPSAARRPPSTGRSWPHPPSGWRRASDCCRWVPLPTPAHHAVLRRDFLENELY